MKEKIEALKSGIAYIDNIKIETENLVDKINSGEENNAMNIIIKVADRIESLIEILRLTSDIYKGEILIKNMNEKLAEIIEAFQNEDYVLIGDLFNYEFLPAIESIQCDMKKVVEYN